MVEAATKPIPAFNKVMIIQKKIEDVIQKINLTEALESHQNYCTLFAMGLLSRMIGWDAEEDPRLALLTLVGYKNSLPMKDLLDMTGLSKGDYLVIFKVEGDMRFLRFDWSARSRMTEHLEREDLHSHQRAISELLLKAMKGEGVAKAKLDFALLTGRFLDVDYPQDEALQDETYTVTTDELNEAMRLFFLHIHENQAKEIEAR